MKVVPGSFGTFAGLKTDATARVLDATGMPIPGLHAAGTDMASVMGGHYPAGGINLGPAMTFGYIAGRHAAGVTDDEGSQATAFDGQRRRGPSPGFFHCNASAAGASALVHRFFFDVREGVRFTPDDDGVEFPNIDAAKHGGSPMRRRDRPRLATERGSSFRQSKSGTNKGSASSPQP